MRPLSLVVVWRMLSGMLLRRLRLSRNCRSWRTRVILAVVVLNVVFVVSLYRAAGGGGGGASGAAPTTSPPAQNIPVTVTSSVVQGTPLLDRLDSVSVRRDIGMSGFGGELELCEDWTAGVPDVNMDEHQRWQIVDSDGRDTFVFSAYFDPRSASSHSTQINSAFYPSA